MFDITLRNQLGFLYNSIEDAQPSKEEAQPRKEGN
jgi:hypothetical protein